MTLVFLTESPGGLLFRPSLPVWAVGAPANVTWSLPNMMIEDSFTRPLLPSRVISLFHNFIKVF